MHKRKNRFSAIGDFLGTNPGIFIAYMLVSFVVILAFRFIFPGEPAPLENLFLSWRFTRGVVAFIGLFPSLVMSALVIPFGFKIDDNADFGRFSPLFILKLQGSILTAIIASACYGLLSFAALPMAREAQSNMRYKGELFKMARQRAEIHAAQSEWQEAYRFLNICENIWYQSPPMERLRQRLELESVGVEAGRRFRSGIREFPVGAGNATAQRKAVQDVLEALDLARTALAEERYYDAHWLATVASRLARSGSVEARETVRVASLAWNAVSSLEPGLRETQSYRIFQLKRQGYEAMVANEWIRAYYIFRELSEQTPEDPDVAKFLAMSQQGAADVAFFVDELEGNIGQNLTNAVFSIPLAPSARAPGGRVVMRSESLLLYPDYSYAIGLELLAFDGNHTPLYEARARYAKVVPMAVQGKPRLVILLQALDRHNETVRWEPVWDGPKHPGPEDPPIALEATYEDFLRLSQARRSVDSILLADLLAMSRDFGNYGYIPQVFQAEIIRRIFGPMTLLPFSILIIIIGWRFRAKTRPKFLGFTMLALIPLVFNGGIQLIRRVFSILGLGLLLYLGYSPAIAVVIGGSLLLFILALICLASQHG
ncbi:MAG: hypothetical protein LBK63_13555 [Treponema sp.]|jgi:hypothetical protein|nr:hypothetical protein [Treponema sp.]